MSGAFGGVVGDRVIAECQPGAAERESHVRGARDEEGLLELPMDLRIRAHGRVGQVYVVSRIRTVWRLEQGTLPTIVHAAC